MNDFVVFENGVEMYDMIDFFFCSLFILLPL